MTKPILVIWNHEAGSAQRAMALKGRLQSQEDIVFREARASDNVTLIARMASSHFYRLVAVAGGDGTVNAVVQGLLQCEAPPPLAVIPLGTGNDFARSLGIAVNEEDAVNSWLDAESVPPALAIDLIKVEGADGERIFANMASGGNSTEVSERVDKEVKEFWGALAYIRAAAMVVGSLSSFEAVMRFDEGEEEKVSISNIIVANGRTIAGGLKVASTADLEDGLLDVIVIKDLRGMDLATLGAQLIAGNYLSNERVIHRRARRFSIDTKPPLRLVTDGELSCKTPLIFTVLPKALQVVVGPNYPKAIPR